MGKRGRGRPKIRRLDELMKNLGIHWMNEAKDRLKWKGLVHSYAQQWAAEGAKNSGDAHLPLSVTLPPLRDVTRYV